ncbi:hypothetical protein INT43_000263 [Umbelopsis isabellina]|uniref:Uncharacterized protein n=1 Tax=Mortierella isabellina TaxID=91625 RepID=A0A8H7UAL5_MORIS|nr:hypothetical protein INT43_000263 [Umbelopsis isabellina]
MLAGQCYVERIPNIPNRAGRAGQWDYSGESLFYNHCKLAQSIVFVITTRKELDPSIDPSQPRHLPSSLVLAGHNML